MSGCMEGTSEAEVYVLRRKRKEIFRGTLSECWGSLFGKMLVEAADSGNPDYMRSAAAEGYSIKPTARKKK